MSFETDMLACANEEDRRRKEADALDREQGRLQSLALVEAMQGNTDKLWSAVDYADHEKRLMRVLMWAHSVGHYDATLLVRNLAQTYAINNAEVSE